MLCSITPNAIESEIVRIAPIKGHDPIEHIVPMIIDHFQRRSRILCDEKSEWFRRVAHAGIRKHFRSDRMSYGQELQAIHKHRFLEFVGYAQFVPAILL